MEQSKSSPGRTGTTGAEEVASNLNTNTPISSLAPELLSLIFQLTFDSTDDETIPVNLSQVSQTWRDVATSNPLLWNRFTISLPLNVEATALKLKRSKESLLDLYIIVPYLSAKVFNLSGLSVPTFNEYRDLSRELSRSYHRCRRLRIEGTFKDAPNLLQLVIAPLLEMAMPYLEEFTLNGESNGQDADFKTDQIFTDAPRLRKVCLGGHGLLYFRPPTFHITTLHLVETGDYYPYSLFASLLQSIPCLIFLAIYDGLLDSNRRSTDLLFSECAVPKLESLFVTGGMFAVSELLLFLSAPNLRELVIAPAVDSDLDVLHAWNQSKSPRFPNLQSLTISPDDSSSFIIFKVASECFPGLKRLVIPNMAYERQFEEYFGASNPPLFPDLRELAVTNVCDTFLSTMDRVLSSRGGNSPWITTLYMDTTSILHIDPMARKWEPYGPNILVKRNIWSEQCQRMVNTVNRTGLFKDTDSE